jgi:hypothetical protein
MGLQRRRKILVFLAVSTVLLSLSVADANQSFEITVHAVSDKSPEDVTIQGDHEAQPTSLSRDASESSTFRGAIELTFSAEEESGSQRLRAPYVLVGRWEKASEQLHLGLGLGLPKKLETDIFHEEVSEGVATLEALEALGKDQRSQLRCYFLSRAHHRKWRYRLGQPCHETALRGAKLWFDSAAWLALRRNPIFMMDSEIVKIMKEYEELAKNDKRFNKRYRQYVRPGYVDGIIEQTTAAPFSVAGKIPSLVKTGQLDEAMELNAHVKTVLTNQTPNVRQVVERHQKVNLDLLNKNEGFILKLKRETGGRFDN